MCFFYGVQSIFASFSCSGSSSFARGYNVFEIALTCDSGVWVNLHVFV